MTNIEWIRKKSEDGVFSMLQRRRFDHLVIVVVDNNLDVRMALGDFFSRRGATVEVYQSMQEALNVAPHFLPNLVISAVAPQDKDGSEFLQDVFALNLAGDGQARVIAMADVGRKNLHRLREIGLTAILCKPFTPDNLLQAIASLSLPLEGALAE